MQSAEMELCDDPTDAVNFARNWRVLVQRQMRAGLVVICHVRQQQVPKMPLAKHNELLFGALWRGRHRGPTAAAGALAVFSGSRGSGLLTVNEGRRASYSTISYCIQ